MANCSTTINRKYKKDTFVNAKLNYEWIIKNIEKLDLEGERQDVEYHFRYGQFSCYGSGYEEFIKEAFDVNNFALINISIRTEDLYISIRSSDVYISTSNKIVLHNLVELLQTSEKDDSTVTNIYNASVINGDDNIVVDGGSMVTVGDKNIVNKEGLKVKVSVNSQGKTGALRTVILNLVSNGIWYLIMALVAGTAIVFYIK